ncbi:FMR1-interacting protein NUFIP1 isoform X2 [Hydra vulgaris]|uniref:FMR1-interacting protein NUFIP1 isoform X2 n=1 Tax=Hydra vulgaris TaxID=6087 RepID=A0ABM4B6K1_HYDVU
MSYTNTSFIADNGNYKYQQESLDSSRNQRQFYAPFQPCAPHVGSPFLFSNQDSVCNLPSYVLPVVPPPNIMRPPHLYMQTVNPPCSNQFYPPQQLLPQNLPLQQQYNNFPPNNNSWNNCSLNVNGSNFLQTCSSFQGDKNNMRQYKNFHSGHQKNNNFLKNQNSYYNQNKNYKKSFNENSTMKNKESIPNGLYRCDPCEKDFNGEKALLAHQKMHIKCEECSFSASSKSVKLHFIQNHAEGKFRICLETPEKIEKWREERRRNWPSQSNIAEKQKRNIHNQEAGAVIEKKEFTYQERGNRNERNKARRGERKKCGIRVRSGGKEGNFSNENKQEKLLNANDDAILATKSSDEIVKKTITPDSSSIQEIVENSPDSSSIQGSLDIKTVQSVDIKTASNNGLSLLHEYDDSCDEQPNSLVKEIETKQQDKEEGELDTESEEHIKENLEEASVLPVAMECDPNNNSSIKSLQKRSRGRKRKGKQNANQSVNPGDIQGPQFKKVSLLEMLLANEIRHERNLVLQCIRHIVKKNFFE